MVALPYEPHLLREGIVCEGSRFGGFAIELSSYRIANRNWEIGGEQTNLYQWLQMGHAGCRLTSLKAGLSS